MVDKVERKAKIFHRLQLGIADLRDLITVEATEEAAVVEVTNTRDANEHNQQTLINLMCECCFN